MEQIIAFTFPHVGNVGVNIDDVEQLGNDPKRAAKGAIFRDTPTPPANWRSTMSFNDWLLARGVVGLSGIDTRALTRKIRENGMPHGVIAHSPMGQFDLDALTARAKAWAGLNGLDLAIEATSAQSADYATDLWEWPQGYSEGTKHDFKVVCRRLWC